MMIRKKGVNNEKTLRYKIWKSSPSAEASVMVTPKEALLIANPRNFVAASPVGVTLTGNVTMNCLSEQRRMGGLFIANNDFLRMIPQTIATPIASQIPFAPVALPLAIMTQLPFFIATLL
jgi:hypothetical protein